MIAPKKNGRNIKGEISKQLCDRHQEMRRENKGHEPQIHGWVLNLKTGLIKDMQIKSSEWGLHSD